jgi:hypothetical protein
MSYFAQLTYYALGQVLGLSEHGTHVVTKLRVMHVTLCHVRSITLLSILITDYALGQVLGFRA